jgi:hypothetical protein
MICIFISATTQVFPKLSLYSITLLPPRKKKIKSIHKQGNILVFLKNRVRKIIFYILYLNTIFFYLEFVLSNTPIFKFILSSKNIF